MSDDRLTDLLTRAVDRAVEGVVAPPAPVVPLHRRRSPWLAPLASAAAVAVVVLGGVALLGGQPVGNDSPSASAPPLGNVDPAQKGAKTVFIAQPVPDDLRAGVDDCLLTSGATRTRKGEPDFNFYAVSDGQAAPLTACLGEAVGTGTVGLLDEDGKVITGDVPGPERYTEGNLRNAFSRVVPGTLRDTRLPGVQAWLAESQDGLQVCFGRITTGENDCGSGAVRYSSISPHSPGTLIGGAVPTDATAGSVRLAIPGPSGVRNESLPAVVIRFDQLPDVALVLAEWPEASQEVRGRTGMEFVPQPE